MDKRKLGSSLPTLSTDDLDQPLIVVGTKNWLALLALLLLASLTFLWLMTGSIPEVVKGEAFFWETKDEKVIYAALPVELGQKVQSNSPVLIQMSAWDRQKYGQLKGEVIENFITPMNLDELQKKLPSPSIASFLMGGNKVVVLLKIQPSIPERGLGTLASGSTGEISIRIASLKPIQYVVPSWGN
jgi:hypothetical protein